jgi:UDP-N-acetylglucosamine 2-epimerase (non-hydrolysing)
VTLKRIITVVGARPNFMKAAPLHREFQKYETIRHLILHTGQHYDEKMSKVFFVDLELPKPDIYLGVGSDSHAVQTAKVMIKFEKAVLEEKPDLVVVVGDVNSTLACSLVCSKLLIPVAHVEAGLRSFDRTMPEEINRQLTDIISDYLFVTEPAGVDNLLREGVGRSKIFLVGDVMIDSLIMFREKAKSSAVLDQLHLTPRQYTLVTLHRPVNVDNKQNLEKILEVFERIAERSKIVFPVHPRTRKMMEQFGLGKRLSEIKNLLLTEPIGYLDFLCLMDNAALILTDSGGIQEESTFLRVPCLTLRENTERPVTVEIGSNQIMGLNVEKIIGKGMDVFDGKPKIGMVPELWDGKAAERIAKILVNSL